MILALVCFSLLIEDHYYLNRCVLCRRSIKTLDGLFDVPAERLLLRLSLDQNRKDDSVVLSLFICCSDIFHVSEAPFE